MPPLAERLALAERTLVGLADGAELPAKIGVHPRPAASFIHAMPAHLRGDARRRRRPRRGEVDRRRSPATPPLGLPGISASWSCNDPATGHPRRHPRWRTDHRRSGPPRLRGGDRALGTQTAGRAPRAAVIGAGVQGHAHVPVLGHVLPGVEIAIHDRDPRPRRGPRERRSPDDPGIAPCRRSTTTRERPSRVPTSSSPASRSGRSRQVMTDAWFAPDDARHRGRLRDVGAAEVARGAGLFVVDESAPVPGEPGGRPLRRLPGPGAILGRGDPSAGHARDRPAGRRDPPRRRPRRPRLRRRDPRARRGARHRDAAAALTRPALG